MKEGDDLRVWATETAKVLPRTDTGQGLRDRSTSQAPSTPLRLLRDPGQPEPSRGWGCGHGGHRPSLHHGGGGEPTGALGCLSLPVLNERAP